MDLEKYFKIKYRTDAAKAKKIIDRFGEKGAASVEDVAAVLSLVNEKDSNGIAAYFKTKGCGQAFDNYVTKIVEREKLRSQLKTEYENMILRIEKKFDESDDEVPEEIYPQLMGINYPIEEFLEEYLYNDEDNSLFVIERHIRNLKEAVKNVSAFNIVDKKEQLIKK